LPMSSRSSKTKERGSSLLLACAGPRSDAPSRWQSSVRMIASLPRGGVRGAGMARFFRVMFVVVVAAAGGARALVVVVVVVVVPSAPLAEERSRAPHGRPAKKSKTRGVTRGVTRDGVSGVLSDGVQPHDGDPRLPPGTESTCQHANAFFARPRGRGAMCPSLCDHDGPLTDPPPAVLPRSFLRE